MGGIFFKNLELYSPLQLGSGEYFKSLFETTLNWKEISLTSRTVTVRTFTRMFQYKIINNNLYLNKMLFVFKKVTTPLCSFFESNDETPIHFFFDYLATQNIWKQLCSLTLHT